MNIGAIVSSHRCEDCPLLNSEWHSCGHPLAVRSSTGLHSYSADIDLGTGGLQEQRDQLEASGDPEWHSKPVRPLWCPLLKGDLIVRGLP